MKCASPASRLFDTANLALLGLLALTVLYPFVYTLSVSLSGPAGASRGGLHLWPREPTLDAYRVVLADPMIVRAFFNSVLRTLLGTLLTVLCCAVAAYPLSRPEFRFRRPTSLLILFTMIFSGGLVPTYLLVRGLGLLDTLAALILPTLLSAFNIIIIKNFFQSLPESLVEAARIDGAGEWTILFRIYLPLSAPVLATVGLWTAVAHWNAWFDGLLYIVSPHKQVLQVMLQEIVIDSSPQFLDLGMTASSGGNYNAQTVKAATAVITIAPIFLVYPFVQRFFNKGILLGGVKE